MALLSSLQDTQKQLAQTRGALARLSEDLSAAHHARDAAEGEERERGRETTVGGDFYELDIDGPEILRCKYQASVAESGELREELKVVRAELDEVRVWQRRG